MISLLSPTAALFDTYYHELYTLRGPAQEGSYHHLRLVFHKFIRANGRPDNLIRCNLGFFREFFRFLTGGHSIVFRIMADFFDEIQDRANSHHRQNKSLMVFILLTSDTLNEQSPTGKCVPCNKEDCVDLQRLLQSIQTFEPRKLFCLFLHAVTCRGWGCGRPGCWK